MKKFSSYSQNGYVDSVVCHRWSSPIETLERWPLNYDLILVYKILHGLPDCSLYPITSHCRYSIKQTGKSFCSHDIYKHFYTNRVVDRWNKLPNDAISGKSLYSFKCKLRMLNFSF